jgi:glycosyltransferase involved in cell wall biosynthesis
MPRYWTINGRFLSQSVFTGVQRYAREILNAIDDLLSAGHPLGENLVLEVLVPPSELIMPRFVNIPVRRVGHFTGHLWEQLSMPLHASGGILSLCNTSTVLRRKQIVCIHDVNTLIVPQSYSWAFRTFYRITLPILGRVASLVATVSNYSAEQIIKQRWATPDKLVVIPNGYEHVRRWTPRHSAATKAVASLSTVVLLGSLAPHKNINLLLHSSRELASYGLKLAIVGDVDSKVFSRVNLGPEASNVEYVGGISDDELAALLKDSLCLAFPSLAEGFGLPPLEAMALGCPIVVSDRTSLPEVSGAAALYASAENPNEWLECFLNLRNDESMRQRQIALGLVRAEHFLWRTSAELYLRAMARVDGIEPIGN